MTEKHKKASDVAHHSSGVYCLYLCFVQRPITDLVESRLELLGLLDSYEDQVSAHVMHAQVIDVQTQLKHTVYVVQADKQEQHHLDVYIYLSKCKTVRTQLIYYHIFY